MEMKVGNEFHREEVTSLGNISRHFKHNLKRLGKSGSKSRWLCPGEAKPLDSLLALLGLRPRNRARSSFIRTSHHSSLALAEMHKDDNFGAFEKLKKV
jgi:hypothetical protein